MARRPPRNPVLASRPVVPALLPIDDLTDPDAALALWLGERLRRASLGGCAALLTARAFWPSEPDFRTDAGDGLVWVFALFLTVGLGIAGSLISGRFAMRWSWADLGVIALVGLVALSSLHAIDHRPALNLAWEWVAFGLVYWLIRSLPRTRGESTALAGALAATAVAVAVYGLFQVVVELPELRTHYLGHKLEALNLVGITPGSPQQALYEDRLLGSNEPYSTFALANSLAGFLVGPLVVCLGLVWQNLTRRDGTGSRLMAVGLAVVPGLLLLVCLVLTKSRSAWVGLTVGLLVLAFNERHRVRKRTLALAGMAGLALVVTLAWAGLATGRLDRLVLTQSGKSMKYRQQYWVGTWRAINATPAAYSKGFGPGNFGAPYVLHKLPEASEEVNDPHNFVLEVWATAGLWAVVALAVAVGFILWNTLGPPKVRADEPADTSFQADPSPPPSGPGWLVACSACGLLLVVVFRLTDFFQRDMLNRWLVLAVGWWLAVGFGRALWRRRPLDGSLLGAAVVAVLVNLTAAGGVGIPVVALGLWTAAALGLNLRDDRPCGRSREAGGRLAAFALAAVWVALLGTFLGAVVPFWKSEAAMAVAEDALNTRGRAPDFDRAENAYLAAIRADGYSSRPWLAMAAMEYQAWMSRGGKVEDKRWNKIPLDLAEAVTAPRPTNSWSKHRERAMMMKLILSRIGPNLPPMEITRFRANVIESSRKAVRLYPTNASLRAWLAEASAEISMNHDAAKEGREALRLDALTPHLDKKLDPKVRLWLESKVPAWEAAAQEAQGVATPKGKNKK